MGGIDGRGLEFPEGLALPYAEAQFLHGGVDGDLLRVERQGLGDVAHGLAGALQRADDETGSPA